MSVDVGELTPPPVETTGKTEIPPKEKATTKANELIDKKIDSVALKHIKPDGDKEKIDVSSMDDNELNLYQIDLLRGGFTDESYKDGGIELRGGLVVKTTDGQVVTVSTLLGEEDKDIKKIYKAKTEIEDPDNPGETKASEVFVEAEEIVRAHMVKTADSITANFDDSKEAALVKWLASGSTEAHPDLPPEAKEKELTPIEATDQLISDISTSIKLDINNLKAKEGKLTKEEKVLLAQKEQLLLQLQVDVQMNGVEGFPELGRLQALIMLENSGVKGLGELQEQLEPSAEKALQTLRDKLINEADATDSDLKDLHEQGLNALLTNPKLAEKFSKIQGVDKLIFGREMSNDEIITMLGQNLTDQQREWLKKSSTIGGGLLLAILIGLAAIPAAAIYGSAQLATSQKR